METTKKIIQATKLSAAAYILYKLFTTYQEITEEDHSFLSTVYNSRKERARDDGNVMAKLPYFLNKDNLYIFWNVWEPKNQKYVLKPKGVIVICHGLNEHSGRYHHVANIFADNGYKVYAIDHQGHGKSEGDRVHAKDFNDLVDDVLFFLQKVHAENKSSCSNFFLLGHSMGALISILTAYKIFGTAKGKSNFLTGLILSAPPLMVDPKKTPDVVKAALVSIAAVVPKLRFSGLKLDISTLTRDKNVVDFYVNDPLHSNHAATLRFLGGLVTAMDTAMDKTHVLEFVKSLNESANKMKILIIHGDKDELAPINGSEKYISIFKESQRLSKGQSGKPSVKMEDLEFISYPGGFHEGFNEPNFEDGPVKDVLGWIKSLS